MPSIPLLLLIIISAPHVTTYKYLTGRGLLFAAAWSHFSDWLERKSRWVLSGIAGRLNNKIKTMAEKKRDEEDERGVSGSQETTGVVAWGRHHRRTCCRWRDIHHPERCHAVLKISRINSRNVGHRGCRIPPRCPLVCGNRSGLPSVGGEVCLFGAVVRAIRCFHLHMAVFVSVQGGREHGEGFDAGQVFVETVLPGLWSAACSH